MSTALTTIETTRLEECEAVIETGLQTFFEVGTALLFIKQNNLYREEAKTFEDYCKTRWNMSQRQANRLVDASEVMKEIGPIGPLPKNESQARPLTALPAGKRKEAWDKAVEASGGKPTAKVVQAVVDEIQPKTVKVSPVLQDIGARLAKNQFDDAEAHVKTADEETANQPEQSDSTETEPATDTDEIDERILVELECAWRKVANDSVKARAGAWAQEMMIPLVTKILRAK